MKKGTMMSLVVKLVILPIIGSFIGGGVAIAYSVLNNHTAAPVSRTITLEPKALLESSSDNNIDGLSLEKVMENCYFHFQGGYVVKETRIMDDESFKNYHLRERINPDSNLCANVADEETIINTRKEVLGKAVGQLDGTVEIVLLEDRKTGEKLIGFKLSGGQMISEKAILSATDCSVGFFFDEINWASERNTEAYTYYMEDNLVKVVGECSSYYSNTGGIAEKLSYDISISFSEDGIIYAVGEVTVVGYGSEEVVYYVHTTATDARADELAAESYPFQQPLFTYESAIDLPTEKMTVQDYSKEQLRLAERLEQMPVIVTEEPVMITETPVVTSEEEVYEEEVSKEDYEDELEKQEEVEKEKMAEEAAEAEKEKMTEEEADNSGRIVKYDSDWIKADATSELVEKNISHSVFNMLDGDLSTAWVEGVDGVGEGESVMFYFSEPVNLSKIQIANGYLKSQKTYNNNGKVKEMIISFSNGDFVKAELDNAYYSGVGSTEYTDILEWDEPVYTDYVVLTIVNADKGDKYSDTCISEVEFYVYEE
ncbi:NADase-type glycan-binding domain-containing protein [Anaeromicropila populeti]|uniref:Nicotine adenine dinucleotide glycohydrolase (NADase) n=1 Tax=Anaeromicropila populeti TaxID=37658 RepID=A0A1I6K804_9FIRM|nr:hypothetical protein [Anaeromicropila populeti]SFR87346.1 Nicotine adenine dinucleotide glycohydrolase (NADase) [Anaeromicropila populeti]